MPFDQIKKAYGTDKQLEREGFWYRPPGMNMEFLLARMTRTNKKWAKRVTVNYKEHKRSIDSNEMNDDSYDDLLKTFCLTILLDWRGEDTIGDDGNPVPYTFAAGYDLLTDLPDLYEELAVEAQYLTNYKRKQEEEIMGKSQVTTSGS